jgi:hypothetical protein
MGNLIDRMEIWHSTIPVPLLVAGTLEETEDEEHIVLMKRLPAGPTIALLRADNGIQQLAAPKSVRCDQPRAPSRA